MIKQCIRKECEAIFSSFNLDEICPACKAAEDEAFNVLRDFLVERPGASVIEIYRETQIPINVINNLLASDRLKRFVVRKCNRCRVLLDEQNEHSPFCQACLNSLRREFDKNLARHQLSPDSTKVLALAGRSYGLAKTANY